MRGRLRVGVSVDLLADLIGDAGRHHACSAWLGEAAPGSLACQEAARLCACPLCLLWETACECEAGRHWLDETPPARIRARRALLGAVHGCVCGWCRSARSSARAFLLGVS